MSGQILLPLEVLPTSRWSPHRLQTLSFPLPSFLFNLGAGDAGDPGDRGMASGFVGVFNRRSVSFLAGDSILGFLSDFGGLLSPSGSGLVVFVFRSETEAGRGERQDENKWVNEKVKG